MNWLCLNPIWRWDFLPVNSLGFSVEPSFLRIFVIFSAVSFMLFCPSVSEVEIKMIQKMRTPHLLPLTDPIVPDNFPHKIFIINHRWSLVTFINLNIFPWNVTLKYKLFCNIWYFNLCQGLFHLQKVKVYWGPGSQADRVVYTHTLVTGTTWRKPVLSTGRWWQCGWWQPVVTLVLRKRLVEVAWCCGDGDIGTMTLDTTTR